AEQASALMREHLLTPIPIIQQAMAGKLLSQQS
ncbi:TPA: transcriptional regulator, partial [Klebsiella pneumoniae subsp. pneumoniae]|nr:transcriptional regulator [Klebsiella pneumoniae subsp. pneumoniae]